MKKRILTKALSVMLCGTAVAQTGLSMTPPIMAHAETPDENGVLITNPMQTVSFYDMFGDAIVPTEKMKSISYSIINKATSKSVKTGVAKYSENYKIDTSGLPKVDESGATINYSVKLWMPDGIEKDEDKSTATHLAIKVEKRYSHRKVWLQLLQRNGVKLLGHTPQWKYEIKLSPPESVANDNRFKEKIVRVDANWEYRLTDTDKIFETDKLGNKIDYKVDINPTPTDDDNYRYHESLTYINKDYNKKETSTLPDGTYIIPYVRKNPLQKHIIFFQYPDNVPSDIIDNLDIAIKEIPNETSNNILHIRDIKTSKYANTEIVNLPIFNESTDDPAKYEFQIRDLNGNFYGKITQASPDYEHIFRGKEMYHKLYVTKRINRVTLSVLNYNNVLMPRYPFVNKIPSKIKAKIKKNGNVLDEIELTTDWNVLSGISNMRLLEYMGFINENKVPLLETTVNTTPDGTTRHDLDFAHYDLEFEPPEGYDIFVRDPTIYRAWEPGNKVTAYIKRKKVPLDKTIKLTFDQGTEPPEKDITATLTYEYDDPEWSWPKTKNETITFNQTNNWTVKLDESHLLYNTNDEKIDYKIKFKRPAHYVISEPVVTDTLNTYTLTKGEPKLSGNISVKFEDYNGNKKTGNESYLPENVNISFVSRDGSQGNSNITLNKDSGYTYDISTLPKEKPNGDDYDYMLTAPKITGYDNPVINGYEVTYKRTKETIGNSEAPLKAYFKKYDTTSDDALTAKTIANPDVNSVTVRLKNGETVTLTKENSYTLNLTGKPKYDTNDNIIDYSVDTVDAPNGYELLKIEGNKNIVLRAIPEHYTTTISTNFKSYNDNPFKGSTKDDIDVTIFRTTANITDNNFDEVTGEEVKKVMLSKSDGYSVTLTDLPKTNPDGEAYHYFIKMDNITGFEKTYTKNEIDGNLTLGVTHKRIKLFTTRKVKIKFVNNDGSVIACNPINKIKITIYRNGDKLEEKDVTITNAETDITITGLLYHEEESNYNGRLYHYEIVPSPIEGFNEVTNIDDDGFSSVTITYTSIKKLDTPCTDLTPTEPVDEPTPPKKEVIPWTDLVPANPIEPVDPDHTVPNKEVIPWTDLVPATPIKPDTPSNPTEPEKKSVPWTDLIPATPINDTTPVLPVIPTVPEVVTTPLIPVIQPVTEPVTKPAIISESSIVTPVEPKVTTESGVQVVPDTSSEENTSTKEKPVTHKTEPKKEAKQDETLDTDDDDTPITDAKIKRLKELQRKKVLREKLKRAKIRKTLPKTGGTNVYYYMVPGGILMLSAMGLMLKRKKKK